MYKVYVKTDENGRVLAINSDAFLSTLEGWQEIDNGTGDKYHHAQGNYLTKPILDDRGLFNYKWHNGKLVERTASEKNAEYVEPVKRPSLDERMESIEKAITLLKKLLGVNL